MKSISFNEQYGDWNAYIRALVLGMLSLFMIIVYSATFIIAESQLLVVENEQEDVISQSSVLGIADKRAIIYMDFNEIDDDVVSFSLNMSNSTSPIFANFVFYSPNVEIFDTYCIDIVKCTAELEGDYLYIGLNGVVLTNNLPTELAYIEFNSEDSGDLILNNGLSSNSYAMEQGSDVNLIESAYFSFHLGVN